MRQPPSGSMRNAKTSILTILAWAACVGCSGHQADTPRTNDTKVPPGGQTAASSRQSGKRGAPHDAACVRDDDCRSGYCDRGICVELYGPDNYGRECPPVLPLSAPGWQENTCGGYLCLDGRCRSCQSDAECQHWLNAPKCAPVDRMPGKVCGRHDEPPPPPNQFPAPAPPPPCPPPPPPP